MPIRTEEARKTCSGCGRTVAMSDYHLVWRKQVPRARCKACIRRTERERNAEYRKKGCKDAANLELRKIVRGIIAACGYRIGWDGIPEEADAAILAEAHRIWRARHPDANILANRAFRMK